VNYTTARSLSVAGASVDDGGRGGVGGQGAAEVAIARREASGGPARTSVGASGSDRSRRSARSYPIARRRAEPIVDAPDRLAPPERIAPDRSIDDRPIVNPLHRGSLSARAHARTHARGIGGILQFAFRRFAIYCGW